MRQRPAIALLASALLAGCVSFSPVRRTPPAVPVTSAADRPVALRFPRYGPLFVKLADGTVAQLASWSNGNVTTLWRTPFKVRDFDATTNLVCVLTEAGTVGCLGGDTLRQLEPELVEADARTLAIALNGERCVTTSTGATRCTLAHGRLDRRDLAEQTFNSLGKLKKIVSGTQCGIDFDGRLMCLHQEEGGHAGPRVELEGVLDASLLTNGPYAVSGCALMVDRTVQCWGPNRAGEAGIGRRSWTAARATVPGLANVVSVSVAPEKACALREDGAVFCWGTAFGPDYLKAAAAVPRCATKTTELPPCPEGDLRCKRAEYNARRRGVDTSVSVEAIRDKEDQCVGPGEPPYAPSPVLVTLVPKASAIAAAYRFLFVLRDDGVLVSTGESRDYDENAISPVPNDPRLEKR